MGNRFYVKYLVFLILLLGFIPSVCRASSDTDVLSEQNWYVATYGGQWIGGEGTTSLSGVTDFDNFEESYLYTVNVGKQLVHPHSSDYFSYFNWNEPLYIDGELQVGRHMGIQDHHEFVGVLIARWEYFPWDRELDTSISVGEGFSWASEIPKNEEQEPGKTNEFLNYLLFDIAVSPWEKKRWEGFLRVHHRSGIFGTINGVFGASNFIGLGVRYRY